MTRDILFDTSALCALNNPKDQHSLKAESLSMRINKENLIPLTTDYIVDEATTLLLTRAKNGFHYANNLLKHIVEINLIQLIWIDKERFYAAKKVFERFNIDKLWSFTDCTSYVVMKELEIKTAFTFDANFKQMGFETLGH